MTDQVTPETVDETQTPETAEPSKLKSLADLFSEQPETAEPEEGDEGKPAGDGKQKGKPKSLKALAETLKLEDKDLYAIEVPMANGETRTLGQLKDAVSKQDDFTVRELEFEETRQSREGELIRAQNELRELVQSLPKNAVKPEVLEAIRQKHDATLKRERAATLEAIPAWSDETKRTEEIAGIVEHLKGYGFPASYLTNISDHRVLRYMRENWQREQRIRKAIEAVKPAGPGKTTTGKPTGKAPRKPSATNRRSDHRSGLAAFFSEV